MKWLFIVTALAIVACSGFAHEKRNPKKTGPMNRSFNSVAILELFTSEGCSSCPPADRLLPQLADLDSNIIPLSFHVDYWNHLGWTDPFSKAEYSERQRAYAERFHLQSIYTPQLIINGEYELVGSDRSRAQTDIKTALSKQSAVQIKIDEVKRNGNNFSIACHFEGDWKQTNLTSVLVQKYAEMKIKGGENGGRKLSHTNVVRSFLQLPAQQRMNFEIGVPADLEANNSQLVFYTQEKNNLKITGAAVYHPVAQ